MLYRVLPTDSRAMPLDCSSTEFVTEYLACRLNPFRSTSLLYELVLPFLQHWVRMITDPTYAKDINYLALCGRLGSEALETLQYYQEWTSQTSSLREELEILFFERLRNLRYYPKMASPKMAEYVIAMDFRNYLKDRIVSSTKHPIDIPVPDLTFSTLVVEDKYPDHLLLKNLGLSTWESYLLKLMKQGLNTSEISALTHIPRKTFAHEETEIWLRLRQRWHQA